MGKRIRILTSSDVHGVLFPYEYAKGRGRNCLEAFDKGIKGGVGNEIRNRHDFVSLYPSGQGSLTDDKVRIGGNGVDGAVGAGNPVEVVF